MKKVCSKCKEDQTLSSFYKDRNAKLGVRSICKRCDIKRRTSFRKENLDQERSTARKRYDPARAKADRELFNQRHPGAYAEHEKNYRVRNYDMWILYARDRNNLRRSRVRQATPDWLTEEQKNEILQFYETARQLTIETGVPHHVDHIHPLNGKILSGLHVPWNLQVLTATENLSKGNRHG